MGFYSSDDIEQLESIVSSMGPKTRICLLISQILSVGFLASLYTLTFINYLYSN